MIVVLATEVTAVLTRDDSSTGHRDNSTASPIGDSGTGYRGDSETGHKHVIVFLGYFLASTTITSVASTTITSGACTTIIVATEVKHGVMNRKLCKLREVIALPVTSQI